MAEEVIQARDDVNRSGGIRCDDVEGRLQAGHEHACGHPLPHDVRDHEGDGAVAQTDEIKVVSAHNVGRLAESSHFQRGEGRDIAREESTLDLLGKLEVRLEPGPLGAGQMLETDAGGIVHGEPACFHEVMTHLAQSEAVIFGLPERRLDRLQVLCNLLMACRAHTDTDLLRAGLPEPFQEILLFPGQAFPELCQRSGIHGVIPPAWPYGRAGGKFRLLAGDGGARASYFCSSARRAIAAHASTSEETSW